MPDVTDDDRPTLDETVGLVRELAEFRPYAIAAVVLLSGFTAALGGIGLGFVLPIVELARSSDAAANADGLLGWFAAAYQAVGVPLTIETAVAGVGIVMTVRYATSFVVQWLRVKVVAAYVRDVRTRAFDRALSAQVAYFDRTGSDEILNAIITQAGRAGGFIKNGIRFLENALVATAFALVALALAPRLSLLTAVLLGGTLLFVRRVLDSGYDVGDRMADADERLQSVAQAGTQGIRDVKMFGLGGELSERFTQAVDDVATTSVLLGRNQAVFNQFYQLASALTVFGLLYVGLAVLAIPLSRLAVFLFAMFRLAPQLSAVSNVYYRAEGDLPHAIRTERFLADLADKSEPEGGSEPVPDPVQSVALDDVTFGYAGEEGETLSDVSLSIERGRFVALVGPSGAGKSTIAGLLARLYCPDVGEVRANGVDLARFDVNDWRDRVAVVRQDPWIFDETLRDNLTIGNREATDQEIRSVCRTSQVSEFLLDLPEGLDTELGDDGVRLSGGQRQRVALARALLTDADVLLLDEATSDLDTGLERQVHTAIKEAADEYAVLVIAHRLSTVVDADCIYTIEDGRVTETGDHEELIDADGTYADLYATQVRQ
jgi:subfamily B ATP-binding cassette protein MsbA